MEIILTLSLLSALAIILLILARKHRIVLFQNRGPILIGTLTALLAVGFLYFFYRTPGTAIGVEQPIPFSHRVHAGVKEIQCRFCHPYVGRSLNPGMPPGEKCLYCHKYVIANHPQIRKVHRYFNNQIPVPWRKVNYLAEHVLFNHQRHIKKNIECRECHGPIETMDRIKGRYFYMGFCITCHRQKKANLGCWLACHS